MNRPSLLRHLCALLLLALLGPSAATAQTAPAQPAGAEPKPAAVQRPRIGLVLSGGGARGAAHIGVLKVLEEPPGS